MLTLGMTARYGRRFGVGVVCFFHGSFSRLQLTNRQGLTLVEIVVAAIIGALMAGGTMMAFLMAQKLTVIASTQVEATYYSQQTLEQFRNKIACRQQGERRSDTWFDESCAPDPPVGPMNVQLPPGAGGWVATREYVVEPGEDFDNDTHPDYFKVVTNTKWTRPE